MVGYTLEQHEFLCDTSVKYGFVRKCYVNSVMKEFPADKHSQFDAELRSVALLIRKKVQRQLRVLTEDKLDDVGARFERIPRKSPKGLSQKTGVSQSSARTATQLLKRRPYETTVIHVLQPRDRASRVHFCSWFLQSVVDGEIVRQLQSFSHGA
jgi:hypothetical protein